MLARRSGQSWLVEVLATLHLFGIINALKHMRHRILLAAAFLYLALANIIWIARDTRPPFWDMAYHQSAALRIYDAFAADGPVASLGIPQLTGFYPPLYHSIVALFYAIFGKTVDAAQLANLPAIAILLVATYGIGRRVLDPFSAVLAAALVNFYPILIWSSRETLIDLWLSAMVALAMWVLLKTEDFSKIKESVLFGIVCGLGMLTKWTFPLFVAVPAAWLGRRNIKNASLAAACAALIASYWYAPSGHMLAQFFQQNTAGGMTEGDPAAASVQAAVFYLRALEGYQLFFPLFVAFLAGIVLLARNIDARWTPIILWIVGGWLGLMLFQNKDPRYSAPFLPAVALITAVVFQRKKALIFALVPFLIFQHYLVSFGIGSLPKNIVLMKGVDGPLAWDWNLYTQSYFDLWGRPAREDWKIAHVLEKVRSPNGQIVRVGMVPDIPRFDALAFEFYISLEKLPITINRLWNFDAHAIDDNDYILVSEKDQGFAKYFSRDLDSINQYILGRPESFHIVEWFPLPNGEVIRLYKVGSS